MKHTLLPFCAITFAALASVTHAQTVKDPFLTVTQVVEGLSAPTTMAFIGPDDFLILEKDSGRVRRVTNGALQPDPVLDVNVDYCEERGLLGIAVHPNFPATPSIYLYYTESPAIFDFCDFFTVPPGNRVYRYEWTGSVLTNGTLILDLPATQTFHDGGVIAFGPDKKLYVVIGDQDRDGQLQNNISGAAPDNTSVIVRINDDGSVPSDNPFFSQGGNLAKYFAYGVRNSFGLAFDPVTRKLWDSENGEDEYDEVNLVMPGFNSGWRDIMGPLSRTSGGTSGLFSIPGAQYSDPEFSWLTPVAVTGLAFLNSTRLGAQYRNDLFVADYDNGAIYHFDLNAARNALVLSSGLVDKVADNETELNSAVFATGFGFGPDAEGGITDIKVGPDGNLYVVSIGQGKVFKIFRPAVHDLAVTKITAPKVVTLPAAGVVTRRVIVAVQNRSDHTETITDLGQLTNLVTLGVQSLNASVCPDIVPVLHAGPPQKRLPFVWKSKQKLNVFFDVTFNCAVDSARGAGHEDFSYIATVHHEALGGESDVHPACDVCPRPPLPGNVDPNPNGRIVDKGCGAPAGNGTFGNPVLTDIFVRQ